MEPGNYNSHLSALTWSAQLIIFDYACFHHADDEGRIPELLRQIYGKFFQQLAETPFGHVLQWRLYLFKVSKAAITMKQAQWSLDRASVVYDGVELQMSDVPRLIRSEYEQAHALLYEELLLGAPNLTPLECWRLKDDLDLDDFGRSWLDHPSNAELVDGADQALLCWIEETAVLRELFVASGAGGRAVLCPTAMPRTSRTRRTSSSASSSSATWPRGRRCARLSCCP
jgi:hypothetical protein